MFWRTKSGALRCAWGAKGIRGENEVQWEKGVPVGKKGVQAGRKECKWGKDCRRGRNRVDTWTPSASAPPVRPRDLGRVTRGDTHHPRGWQSAARVRKHRTQAGAARYPRACAPAVRATCRRACSSPGARRAEEGSTGAGRGRRRPARGAHSRRRAAAAARHDLSARGCDTSRHRFLPEGARARGPPGDWSAQARRGPIGRRSQPIV